MSHTLNTKIKKFHDQWCRDNGYDITEQLCNYRQYEKSYKPQAASFKRQADRNDKYKRQAPSSKLQAPSRKRQAPGFADPHKVSRD